MRQRRITSDIGRDTHVRDHSVDGFRLQNHESYQILVGEVEIPEPEPLFTQNMVSVSLARGGRITSVAYPGAFIDPITGNFHGTYEGPIPGQMVMVGFENGNVNTPFVVNKYPYQGTGNTLVEDGYINPMTRSGFASTDVIIGHFSGSYMSFNTGILPSTALPGSVTINAISDFDVTATTNILLDSLVTAEVKGTIVTLTGSTHIELNGNTNFAVKYTELKVAFDQLKTELNAFITVYNSHTHPTAPVGPVSPPSAPGIPATADMSTSQNTKVLM